MLYKTLAWPRQWKMNEHGTLEASTRQGTGSIWLRIGTSNKMHSDKLPKLMLLYKPEIGIVSFKRWQWSPKRLEPNPQRIKISSPHNNIKWSTSHSISLHIYKIAHLFHSSQSQIFSCISNLCSTFISRPTILTSWHANLWFGNISVIQCKVWKISMLKRLLKNKQLLLRQVNIVVWWH